MREQDTCRRSRGVQHALKQGGRQKPHFRQTLPRTGGVLSVDLMGPYAQAFSPQHMERPVVRYAVVGAFLPPSRLQLSEQSHLESHAKQEGLSSPLWQPSQEESNLLPAEYEEFAAGETREDPSATGPNSFYFVEFITSKGQQEVCLAIQRMFCRIESRYSGAKSHLENGTETERKS